MKKILGNSVAKRLLICLYNNYSDNRHNYADYLRKEIDCTISSLTNNISYLKSQGFITNHQDGRRKIITLTEKGKIIARALRDIQEVIG